MKWLDVKCDNFTCWHIYYKSPLSRYLRYKGHFYCPCFWHAFASRKLHTASVWRSRVSVSQVLYLWFTTTKRSYNVLCIHLEKCKGGILPRIMIRNSQTKSGKYLRLLWSTLWKREVGKDLKCLQHQQWLPHQPHIHITRRRKNSRYTWWK